MFSIIGWSRSANRGNWTDISKVFGGLFESQIHIQLKRWEQNPDFLYSNYLA